MNYNKSSMKKRLNSVDSKQMKMKHKITLSTLQFVMIFVIVLMVVGASTVLGIVRGIIDSAPDISRLDVVPTGYSTIVYADDGKTEIATLVGSGANREFVDLDDIPLHLQQAFVSIEDERFYEHNGIDLQGIIRAFANGVSNGLNFDQGASTITQQLIKNNVLTSWTGETTFIERLQRKIQEQYLALKLEQQVQDKDWILENYLNTINLGGNTLGVQSAAHYYFGKDVSELTLSESAVIAGITQNPYGYNPVRFPEKNEGRRERVLNKMLELGYITKTEYDEALADDVYARISAHTTENQASFNGYFVDALIDDVLADLIAIGYSETDAYRLIYRGGLTIVSTQDANAQKICDIEANDQTNYQIPPKYSFSLSFSIKRADGSTKTYTHNSMLTYYRKTLEDPKYSLNFDTEEQCRAAIKQYQGAVLQEGDQIVENSESIVITLQPQVALTVIDQSTGEVKAMTGGRGEKSGNRTLNRATDTTRQPGSVFKVLTAYSAALDAGGMTLASVQDDAPFKVGDKEFRNYDDVFYGLTTIREAIKGSYNITALKTLQEVGVNLGYEYAEKYGITTLVEGDKNLSLALGGISYGVTNLELTAAYASIANGGKYIEPSFYTAIYDHNGNLILTNNHQKTHRVVSKQTAWLLTDAMRDVMTSGTGRYFYFEGMDLAGKTGTTSDSRDSLLAGFSPYYTCVVWGGFDDNSELTFTSYPKDIWREVMSQIHEGLEYKAFQEPSGITTSTVCMDSGYSPIDGTCDKCGYGSTVYTEYFAIGTVPTTACNHHVTLDICKSTGKVAASGCTNTIKKVFIVDASKEAANSAYVASKEFLATVCPHGASSLD